MSYILKINYADKSNYGRYRSINKIKYIVWHYTANDGDTDESNAKYFKTKNRKASAHYFVDDDSITISVPDTYVAWSVGGNRYSNYKSTGGAKLYKVAINNNTLNIELCDTIKNGKYDISEKTLDNAIDLTKNLMKKYNIPISNVIRHFDVTGKSCPAYYTNDKIWGSIQNIISENKNIENKLDYSLVFDADYYSNHWVDLKNVYGKNKDALLNHFINFGMKEGRQAISTFDVYTYRNNYADLRKEFDTKKDTITREDLPKYYKHYITNGYKEKRKAI